MLTDEQAALLMSVCGGARTGIIAGTICTLFIAAWVFAWWGKGTLAACVFLRALGPTVAMTAFVSSITFVVLRSIYPIRPKHGSTPLWSYGLIIALLLFTGTITALVFRDRQIKSIVIVPNKWTTLMWTLGGLILGAIAFVNIGPYNDDDLLNDGYPIRWPVLGAMIGAIAAFLWRVLLVQWSARLRKQKSTHEPMNLESRSPD
jgi:hypothetical protein